MTLFDDVGEKPGGDDLLGVDGLRRLLMLPNVGPARARKLAVAFRGWEQLACAPPEAIGRVIGAVSESVQQALPTVPLPTPLPQDVEATCIFDSDWPAWANEIARAPVLLYRLGSLPSTRSVAVVGTRNPTRFGQRAVESIVEQAALSGSGIVSGLAKGIDSTAHKLALEAGIPTWAFLGSGVDRPGSLSSRSLAEEILNFGGGLVSEYPIGTEANAERLVARNRFQSAASDAVFIAQCGIPSGTLSTARFAIEQGRLLAVAEPKGAWRAEAESAGNVALCNPDGCDPALLKASGGLARKIGKRRPVADQVLVDKADISKVWQGL